MKLEPTDTGFAIEAPDLAQLLDVAVETVRAEMRAGAITSRFERGEGEDEGRFRVTFFRGRGRVQLVVSADGTVLQRSRVRETPPPR
jgi:hypothetical protein